MSLSAFILVPSFLYVFLFLFILFDDYTFMCGIILPLFEPHSEKTGFYLCENKGANQLLSNCEADPCLCFRYTDSTIALLPKSELSSLILGTFCIYSGRFVSDLVVNPEDLFSRDMAHFERFLVFSIHIYMYNGNCSVIACNYLFC